jgi:hypothetical protein
VFRSGECSWSTKTNPVTTVHYISTLLWISALSAGNTSIPPSPTEQDKIWGFHSGNYEECHRKLLCRVALVKSRHFGGTRRLHHQGDKNQWARNCSMRWLLFTDNVVPSTPILVTLLMEALRSSETSALKTAKWRNVPEDRILQKKISFWAIAFLKRFCQISFGIHLFGYCNNNFFTEQGHQPCGEPRT